MISQSNKVLNTNITKLVNKTYQYGFSTNIEKDIIEKADSALYASKVQLVCPKCGEATRVGHKKGGIRVCKKCGNEF